MTSPHTVVVIGGGISGLAAALALMEQAEATGVALRCTVLEAGRAWGGKIDYPNDLWDIALPDLNSWLSSV